MRQITHRIAANGLSHFIRDSGDEAASAVILLHGFPDSSSVWDMLTPLLVEKGHRVIAPDLRGFGETDMAARVEDYDLRDGAARDVIALMDALQIERAHLVGHDFGAALAWSLAAEYPARFFTLSALSVGHPRAFLKAGAEQKRKSFYILVHQLRGIAEWIYRRNEWAALKRQWTAKADIDDAIALLARPGRLTAGLNWYRANLPLSRMVRPPQLGEMGEEIVRIPALGVWPDGDKYLTEKQMMLSSDYVEAPWTYARLEGSSHWLQLDKPQETAALLARHCAAR
ncbi:MAG: alpha/beta fold hydrolase [Parvularculaceae bacterium]